MTSADTLPDDIDALKAMLHERDAQLERMQNVVDSQKAAIATDKAEIEHLKLLIAKLRRMQFGRKSEKLDHQIEQLELRLEELEADEGATPVEIPRNPRTAPEQVQRKPLPEHLPREIQTHLPESYERCAECGAQMKQLGEDVSEQLEYVPASFRVIRHVRPRFACSCCEHMAQAAAPSRPIERGMAGPGLLAHVLVSKFADHLPLYRLENIFARHTHLARGVRAEGPSDAMTGLDATALGISFIEVADPYQSVNRSLKYAVLFLGLVFLSYFIFEATTGKRVHPAQYILVGIAQIIFYLLLLSFAERIGFDYGFMLAGAATVILLSANAGWVFSSRLQAVRAFVIFALLYTLIYLLLTLEDNALLVGAIASFLAVAAAMYFTRRIDWYSSLPGTGAAEQTGPMAPGNPA